MVTRGQVRRGMYYDSLVLMQLQAALAALPGVREAGVMMGTAANKAVLSESGLLTEEGAAARADDLLIVVRAESDGAAEAALGAVDGLLGARRAAEGEDDFLPRSVETAARMMPEARWVMVSVPGRYAAGVAREALAQGRHVFLYSDNVALADEVALKRAAGAKGLLVMGPDCGTAIVNGVGLGFANGARRGAIGLIAASGTGLQAVTARIHALGGGVSHALGTGGRDLSREVGGQTTRQALALLRDDPATGVIVLVSKPPAPEVATRLLGLAQGLGKAVVVAFIGYAAPARRVGNLCFATTLDEAAALAVRLVGGAGADGEPDARAGLRAAPAKTEFAPGQRFVRGLFSGGTLAYEATGWLSAFLPELRSNVPLTPRQRLADAMHSQGHTILDLGADEFTVGRPHPMLDNGARLRRLRQEAADPEVAVVLLDVVLGFGAHPDPARELAPAIAEARTEARAAGRALEVVAMLIGTDADPQGLDDQRAQLEAAGAWVATGSEAALRLVTQLVQPLQPQWDELQSVAVSPTVLTEPLAAINVGLALLGESVAAQGAMVQPVAWRPPAGGDERLMDILARLQRRAA